MHGQKCILNKDGNSNIYSFKLCLSLFLKNIFSKLFCNRIFDFMLHTMSEELDGLSANELEEYKEIFALFDSDGKGYITQVKLGRVMRNFGWDPSESILQVTVQRYF